MPSTYSSSLRLELQATGENANTWGNKTNNNLNLIEQAVAGYVKITLVSASATYTLDIADASASDGRNAFIEFAGTVASAISIVVPDVEKGYWVKNSATGAALTFRTSSGTGFTLPANRWVFAVADSASVVDALDTLNQYARLSAAQVFTGANTFTSATTFTGSVSVSASAAFTQPVLMATVSLTGTSAAAALTLANARELVNVSGAGATGTIDFNLTNHSIVYYTSVATGNWNINFRGNSGTTLNSMMDTGQAITAVFLATQGGTAYYNSAVQVDSTVANISTKWLGGAAPTNGNVSAVDAYSYTIIKTGAATFTVLASRTNFA